MKNQFRKLFIDEKPPLFADERHVFDATKRKHRLLPSRYPGQPPIDRLPHLKRAKAKGSDYFYFKIDDQFVRLPDINDNEFVWQYQCKLAEKEGRIAPLVRRRDIGRVYFIGAGDQAIKIGFAAQPSRRLKDLQAATYIELTILATVDGGQPLEHSYHKRFAEHRIRGEWFHVHPDILSEIERLTQPPAIVGEQENDDG